MKLTGGRESILSLMFPLWLSEDSVDDTDFETGFDLFYDLTPSLKATFTYNTDFAETEVDQQRVNLTRFPFLS